MKYCQSCGAALDDNQAVCNRCGADTAQPQKIVFVKHHRPPEYRELEYNVSGWWAGFFFSWLGVLILILTNIKKPPVQKRHIVWAIVWAVAGTIAAIALGIGL
ncbi:MAG: zinc ribbon domain-containing protein [Acholeplasmatales bacterium]|jgi:uncharacterized membrane protein YvbJ|nr:zinc ribbon domain-containing protein [Acholeplasmatales bacterium]